MARNDLKTASVLAFERKLDPSDGIFRAGVWDKRSDSAKWPIIPVREKSVRGTISNRLKSQAQDPAKLDAAIQNPNLQTIDVATLSPDADTLSIRFTLRVLGGAGHPNACDNPDYHERLTQAVAVYVKEIGFHELARRYAHNLANARFLWRNRLGAETIEVHVRRLEAGAATESWEFNALAFSLRDFEAPSESADALDQLTNTIESGISGQNHVFLDVEAFARTGFGQEVYPSQELILDSGNNRGKSKTLYTVGEAAAMHSQKIGNAVRTIDTWYEDEEGLGPIAVEPYGSVTSRGKAYRQPRKKMDFYTLLDRWMLKDEQPSEAQQHFVMATLIRGGVFGESDK